MGTPFTEMRALPSAVVMAKGRALSTWVRVVTSNPPGTWSVPARTKRWVTSSPDGTVIAGTERVERIADSVHVVEQFTEDAAPGFGPRQV